MDDEFSRQRRRCFAIAYRMLGSSAEADDIVQEAWLRFQQTEGIQSPGAWLTTTVTRLCLDHLKSARVRREQYVGPWLPEPIDTSAAEEVDPESVSSAFLLVLERLSPAERAVHLLHTVFDVAYDEIAAALGKSETAVRQLAHRARDHLAEGRPRYAPTKEQHLQLLTSFVLAVRSGELAQVEALLTAQARAVTDGGGRTRAALNVIEGRSHVARLFVGLVKKGSGDGLIPELRELNGWPALAFWRGNTLESVLMIESDGAVIHSVHVMANPDKLHAIKPLETILPR